VIFGTVLLLVGFGLAVIYSVALGSGEASLTNFKKQCVFAVVGLLLLLIFSFFVSTKFLTSSFIWASKLRGREGFIC